MRTIETPRTVEQIWVDKTYACDAPGCTFTSDSQSKMLEHEKQEHTFTDYRLFNNPVTEENNDICKFETVEAFQKFAGTGMDTRWEGPGWYRLWKEWRHCGRCSSSGCGHYQLHSELATRFAATLREKSAEIMNQILFLQ